MTDLMDQPPQTPKEWLLFAFKTYQIAVLSDQGKFVRVEKDYEVEIEQNGVFKLKHAGLVVAPFRDLDELCSFIIGS